MREGTAISARPPFGPSNRAATLLLAVGFAMLVLVSYADPLFLHRTFAGRDLLAYNLPMEKAIHDAYARGRLPVWFAEVSGGRPLLANPNAGALYPVRALLSMLPFARSVQVFPILHWILAGIGVIFLMTVMGASSGARWLAAVTYTFSGVVVSEVFFPHILPGMMLLPWVVWAIARPSKGRQRILLLSLLFGLDLLAGDLFTIGIALACCVLWIVLEIEVPRRRPIALQFIGAFLLGCCLAAPQIIATSLWIPETNRAVLGLKLWNTLFYSISPCRLLEFLIPYPFGPTWALDPGAIWAKAAFHGRPVGLFATLFCGSLAFVAVPVAWRARRAGVRFARAVLLSTLIFSVLPSLLPARWGNVESPLALRNPEKLAVGAVLALALLAGMAFDRLREERPRQRWTLLIGATLALLAGVSVLRPALASGLARRLTGSDSLTATTGGSWIPQALTEAGLYWMATVVALELLRINPRRMSAFSVALLTVVPVLATRKIAQTFPQQEALVPTAFARMVQKRDPSNAFRVLGESFYQGPTDLFRSQLSTGIAIDFERRNWFEDTAALWNRGTVFNGDFDAGDLARVEALRKLSGFAAAYRDSAPLFENLSLRWGIRFRDAPPLSGFHRIGGDALQDWDEDPAALPDVRLLEDWREEPSSLTALNVFPTLVRGEAVLESQNRKDGHARPGQIRILEKSPERMVVETRTSDPTWLFVLRAAWSYRSMRLDGQSIEQVPAQLAFSAVPIPPGKHRLVWEEIVPGGGVSRFGPILYLMAVLGIGISRNGRFRW